MSCILLYLNMLGHLHSWLILKTYSFISQAYQFLLAWYNFMYHCWCYNVLTIETYQNKKKKFLQLRIMCKHCAIVYLTLICEFCFQLQHWWWISTCCISFWELALIEGLSAWVSIPLSKYIKQVNKAALQICLFLHFTCFLLGLLFLCCCSFLSFLLGCLPLLLIFNLLASICDK